MNNRERLTESDQRLSRAGLPRDTWAGEGPWRIIHRILGSIVLSLGLINVSLGVFLAVLPLPVWVVWYIVMNYFLNFFFCCKYF